MSQSSICIYIYVKWIANVTVDYIQYSKYAYGSLIDS